MRHRGIIIAGLLIGMAALLAAPGCTGAEVAALGDELGRAEAQIETVRDGLDEIRAAMEGLTPEQRARAEPYMATLAATLAEVQGRADGIRERIAALETAEGKSTGNFLVAAAEIAAGFGGLLPQPLGALVLAAGAAAGGIGTAMNRRMAAEVVGSIEVAKRVITPESPEGVVNFADMTTQRVIRRSQSPGTRRFVDRVQARNPAGDL